MRNQLPALFLISSLCLTADCLSERRDPPGEAPVASIAKVLRGARLIEVFCGGDVELDTCKFLTNAIRQNLKSRHVNAFLDYKPETLLPGFYVPPLPFPFTAVTLRLIEYRDNAGTTRAFLGGSCFDINSKKPGQLLPALPLPRWIESEGADETGPLETQRADAARRLAREFAAYWTEVVAKH